MSGFEEIYIKRHSFENLIIAYRTSFAALLAILITFYLHISSSFWAPAAAFAIAASTKEALIYKSWRRILGTIIGCIAAIGLAYLLSAQSWASIFLLLTVAFFGFYLSQKIESYFLLFITAHMIMVGSTFIIQPNEGLLIAYDRIFTNVIGILCIVFINIIVFPIPKSGKKITTTPQSNYYAIRYALFISISIILAILIWQKFDVPGGILNMAITILAITQVDAGGTTVRGAQRLIGCLFGIFFGAILIFISTYGLFYFLLFFFLISGLFIYYHYQNPRHGYGGIQAAMALSITAFPTLGPTIVISHGLYRALGIVIGLLITSLMHYLFNYIETLFNLKPQEIL
ncbi:FUSC family protein [Thiotrichales bacterium 19S3-7]|nr:FUSC family protein [Thiotrichales bacterium 19S3-7]MCF6800860.1 FUSC family protein [Thiotrichales bacterium 19S3-11]